MIPAESGSVSVKPLKKCGPESRKVTVLHEGSVLAEGTIDEVQANPKVQEVYLGV